MVDTRFKKGQKPWNAGTRFKLEKECLRCNKIFTINSPSFSGQRFCSHSCHMKGNKSALGMKPNQTSFKKGHIPYNKGENNPEISEKKHWNWQGGLIKKICEAKNCNNIFLVKKSKLKVGWGRFCSKSCSNKTTMNMSYRKEIMRQKRLKEIFPTKDTSIETKLQNFLKEQGIEFETHYPILGQPDIFIKPNICIFADGCYWHKCPECGFVDKIKNEKDARITRELQKQGYTVFRIWEHDINKNVYPVPFSTP